MKRFRLPAEWEPQSFVQLTWPHKETDWAPMLNEITDTYVEMAHAISKHEPLLIVVPDAQELPGEIRQLGNVSIAECPTNDTWTRDHGFITLVSNGEDNTQPSMLLADFQFNGWGRKFIADKDNAINHVLWNHYHSLLSALLVPHTTPHATHLAPLKYIDHNDFVLEGGSIESDGRGTVYTTRCCLLAPNRNQPLTEKQIEQRLRDYLHADRIVWLDDKPMNGDDTDGHIDTLARILPDGTLLRLPLPDPVFDNGEQLPATYANYLIINGALLVPTYGQPENDAKAMHIIGKAFPDHNLIGIDSRSIIKQHGSIHCCTMQFPKIA